MSISALTNLDSIANDIKDLSYSNPVGKHDVSVKNALGKEIHGAKYFLLPACNVLGLFDTLHESAKQRILIADHKELITEQQITTFTYQLQRKKSASQFGDGFISVEDLYHILSHSPKAIRDCFSSAIINRLVMHSSTYGQCASAQIIVDYIRACCRRTQQRLLMQISARSTDYITSNEFIDFVMAEISNKIPWEDGMKDCPFYYAVFVERSVFFHLDPQRTGKVSIQDLTSTKIMDDLFEVLCEQKRIEGKEAWDSTISWCSLTNYWRILEQFRHCDEDWSGMVSLQECRRIRDGSLTPLFLERIFATQILYGEQSCKEMDFRGFVELDVAIRTRNQPSSIKWLFSLLDLRDDGYLDRYEIEMMTESMLKNMSTLEGYSNFVADDIVDEVIDMLMPSTQNRIYLGDVMNNGMTETAFGILIDYTIFLKYENREDETGS